LSNPISNAAFNRLRTALSPQTASLREFVLTKTRLNGRPFSLKNHEYQGIILDEYSRPDIDIVIEKPSQCGVSEIIYRADLAWSALVSGYASAIVFPTKTMSNEVMATRISQIISECEPLQSLRNNDVDSQSVKMFQNNSIIYALGASTNSRSTVINRPIRSIIADELARCDLDIITALRSRQRHQEHKSSAYFSTPLFEDADIDLEMGKCGIIWEQILQCSRCGHHFFPEFFKHIRLPGFKDELKYLRQEIVERNRIDLDAAFLECPKCARETSYEFAQMEWVDTAEVPHRPKTGIRLSAFCMPHFVKPPAMVKDLIAYSDKNEFVQQVLGRPASKADTTMDVNQILFEAGEPGALNVFGLDLGKISHLVIGTVTQDRLFFHTLLRLPLKTLKEDVIAAISKFNCISGVIDFLPYSDIATSLVNTLPNAWSAIYVSPAIPMPELFKLQVKEDPAFGNIRMAHINKTLMFDTFVGELMSHQIVWKASDEKATIKEHHESLRRIRDPKYAELRYTWIKPQGTKTQDHIVHASLYATVAARLMIKSAAGSLPLSMMLTKFKLTSDV